MKQPLLTRDESRPAVRLRRALLLGLLVAWPRPAAAQSGVLLGLHTAQGYRTLWIATDGDSAALLASGPGLLVPRADGFWRVDVIALDDETELAVAAPAARWSAAVDSMRQSYRPSDFNRCSEIWERERIQFLGPDYLSVSTSEGEGGCGWGGPSRWDRDVVRPLGVTAPSVQEVLDSITSRRLSDALGAIRDSVQALILAQDSGMADLLVDCHEGSWGIRRRPGGWDVWGHLKPYRFYCDGVEVPLALAPPGSVVGDSRTPVDLYEVSLVIPSVVDAVSSPGGDFLIAFTRDSLYAARRIEGRIQRPTLALPVRGRIVMEEWALGRHVQRWTREVRSLLGGDAAGSGQAAAPRSYSQSIVAQVLSFGAGGERRETGDVVLAGRPVIVGFDRASADSAVTVEDVLIDRRRYEAMPDTARGGIRLDLLATPRFLPVGPGRYTVRARVGPSQVWERVPATHEFFAIDYVKGNGTAVPGQPPGVRLSIPDGATGVPVDYLPRLDFSEPVRVPPDAVRLRDQDGYHVPARLAAVGTDGDENARVYPGLGAVGGSVAVHSVTLIPETPLRFGTRYRLVLSRGIFDTDTTAQGAPDAHALSDTELRYEFETYQPRVLSAGDATGGTHIAMGWWFAYLAVRRADGDDQLQAVNLADPTRPASVQTAVLETPGRVRSLSPRGTGPRVAAGRYAPGTLEAIGYVGGREVATHRVRTPGTATRLDLRLDESGRRFGEAGKDVAFLWAELRDGNGTTVPDAWENVFFGATGDVTLVGANPFSSEGGIASILVHTEARSPRAAVYAVSLVREQDGIGVLGDGLSVGGDVEPFEVRVTTDGSVPDVRAQRYAGPVATAGRVRAVLFAGGRPVVAADSAAPKSRIAGSTAPASSG